MRDIPDNVIERLLDEIPDAKWDRLIDQIDYEIAKALPDLDLPRDICEDILCVAINETAPVIAAWARQQERERREARITEANRQRNAGLAALSLLRGRIARLIDLYEITPLLHENMMRDLRSLLPEEAGPDA